MAAAQFKEKFLEDNQNLVEIRTTEESMTIGEFEDIDTLEDEVWFVQCPRGTDLTALQGQKLKLPGRSNVGDLEAVSVELATDAKRHPFGYCNHKGRYAMRLLPVVGSIVLRSRLKANEALTSEQFEASMPPAERVPVPKVIKVRHPLLGFQFADKLGLDKATTERLKRADEASLRITRQTRQSALKRTMTYNVASNKPKQIAAYAAVERITIKSDEDDDVEFVSQTTLKRAKRRKHSEADPPADEAKKSKKTKKSKKADVEEVSEDLKWLKEL